jgi:hypothetical protein
MVQAGKLLRGGCMTGTKNNVGMQRHATDPIAALGVPGHDAGCGIFIRLHGEPGAEGDVKESKHVAGGKGGDEGFFRVDGGGVKERFGGVARGGGGGEGEAAVEGPGVVAGVFAAEEVFAGEIPLEGSGMEGHGGSLVEILSGSSPGISRGSAKTQVFARIPRRRIRSGYGMHRSARPPRDVVCGTLVVARPARGF